MEEPRRSEILRFALDELLLSTIPRARGDWKDGGYESELGPLDELIDDTRKILLQELFS